MRCATCGKDNAAGVPFCQHCGMPFAAGAASQRPELLLSQMPSAASALPMRRTRRRASCLSALGCLVLFLGLCGGLFWGGIVLWEALSASGTQYLYTAQTGEITAIAWSPDSTRIASAEIRGGAEQSTVQIWGAHDGTHFLTFTALNSVQALAWSPDGKRIAIAGRLPTESAQPPAVQIIDAATGKNAVTLRFPNVYGVSWSPDSKAIVTAANDGQGHGLAQIWNASTGTLMFTEQTGQEDTTSVAWSPDGKRIAAGGGDGSVRVWDALTGAHSLLYRGHFQEPAVGSRSITALAWAPDSQWLASADENEQDTGDESTVRVWQPVAGGLSSAYPIDARGLAWSPDGAHIVTVNEQIRIWDALTGDHMFYRSGFADTDTTFHAVAWSPNGAWIASGGFDGQIEVWQPPDERTFVGHTYYSELIKVGLITLFLSGLFLVGAFFSRATPALQDSVQRSGLLREALLARMQYSPLPDKNAAPVPRQSRARNLLLLALLILCVGAAIVAGMIVFGWNINWLSRT